MATIVVPGTDGTILGTAGDDVYVIDIRDVGDVTIVDSGGDDMIVLRDALGNLGVGVITASDTGLVLDTGVSGVVTFTSGLGAPAEIEHLTSVLKAGTPEEFEVEYQIVASPDLPGNEATIYAGTSGPDDIRMVRQPPGFDAPTYAFGGAGRDEIRWGGTWDAHVEGGAASDRLVNTGSGTLFAYGGGGDDVLRNNGSEFGSMYAFGGTGNDTLIGGVSRSVLDGGAGNDLLRAGAAGADLSGGAGNDRLEGGSGEDAFLFQAAGDGGEGSDRIKAFDAEEDTIRFIDARPSEVDLRHADGNTIITYGDGGRIAVLGVTLVEDDLVFAF